MALVYDLAHDVPLSDVGGFVRQYARQFVLVARGQDQPALNGHEAAGYRERVDHRIAQDKVVELVLTLFRVTREAMANLLSVLADLRVGEDQAGVANLVNVGQTRVIFIIDGDRGIRGAAQIRKILIRTLDTLRVTHTNAARDRGGGQECGYGFQS